jgi:uncharacterized protein YecE (DUF72 family)
MLSYAKKAAKWLEEERSVWVFFNNTFHGDALENARLLEEYIVASLKE